MIQAGYLLAGRDRRVVSMQKEKSGKNMHEDTAAYQQRQQHRTGQGWDT